MFKNIAVRIILKLMKILIDRELPPEKNNENSNVISLKDYKTQGEKNVPHFT